MIDRSPPKGLSAPVRFGFLLRITGFLLAALLALTVPGSAGNHADGVFGPHLHDPLTGQAVPLVDERGHPAGAATAATSLDAMPGVVVHAPPDAPLALGDIFLPVALWTLALLPLLRGRGYERPRRPAGVVFSPCPPPPRW